MKSPAPEQPAAPPASKAAGPASGQATAQAASRAAEAAARTAYGRLLALLVARTRDIAAAEDALAEAFAAALRAWPVQGVPQNPEAWLMTAARNNLANVARHRSVVEATTADLLLLADEAAPEPQALPDERLKLLFVCAHPAIAEGVRTPLMLQTVLGLDAAQIGAAFLVAPATMGQRLVRAKAKIRDAGLRFELPTADDLPARLGDVLEAIYAAYGSTWDQVAPAGQPTPELADEALYLARLMVALLPQEPECQGLLSLMLHCEARRPARRTTLGAFVPLDQQDARRWQRDLIIEAEGLLTAASRHGRFGRFQCEAAIQSVHAQRPILGRIHHDALITLYALLARHAPSVGAHVGHAAALLGAGRAGEARALLAQLDPGLVAPYQPYWATLRDVLEATGDLEGAQAALQHALALTTDPATRHHLLRAEGWELPRAAGA